MTKLSNRGQNVYIFHLTRRIPGFVFLYFCFFNSVLVQLWKVLKSPRLDYQ